MTTIAQAVLPGWELTAEGVLSLPCPVALAGTARSWLAGGSATIKDPQPATTVMLVRQGHDAVQVFMLRRAASMAFAAGAVVFPGGRVDPRDADPIAWAGPSVEEWADLLRSSRSQARAAVVCAVRELFEESGVLLAGTDHEHLVTTRDAPEWSDEIKNLEAHRSSLADVLRRHRLILRSDLLNLRARWLTPEFEPRRYDTYFFTAELPVGQRTNCTTREADADRWVAPRDVLRAAALGQVGLLPPTAHSLAQLAQCDSPRQFVRSQVVVERVMLAPIEQQGGDIRLSCRLPQAPGNGARTNPSATPEKEENQ